MIFSYVTSRRSSRRAATWAVSTLASVVTVVALAGCSTVSSASNAFTVNGTTYKKSDFTALSRSLLAAGQFQAAQGSKEISVDDARTVLVELIRHEATMQFLKREGVKEDPAFRTDLEKQAAGDQAFQSYDKTLQDLLIELNVGRNSLTKVTAPSAATVEKLYSSSPASAGVLCLSHILVKTESEARGVLARLDKGEKFADVAKDASIEPGAATSGGALKNGKEDCNALAELQKGFDPDFMVGAVAAKPGVPTGPVKSQFGWHVILSHPFNEVKDSAMRVIAANPGATLLQGFLSTSKVSVDSAYGRWNGATASIG